MDIMKSFQEICNSFIVNSASLSTITSVFQQELKEGLAGRPSSLAMLPSFLTQPTGQETGSYLALDFGGTNVRVLLVDLLANGEYRISQRTDAPLVDSEGSYNYTTANSTAEQLFDFLATKLATLARPEQNYTLGYVFSFPFQLLQRDHAILIHWTKEFMTAGVEGKNVVALLNDALVRKDVTNIHCAAIANDTVSALLTAAYCDTCADIGSICGTGHNTCYLEPNPPGQQTPMYINMESGNFDKIPGNAYDRILDDNSDRPGAGRLEKMSSGRYLGELLRLVLLDMQGKELLDRKFTVLEPYSLSAKDIAGLLTDSGPELPSIQRWLAEHNFAGSSLDDRQRVQTIAALITKRGAQLVATTYAATVRHIDPELTRKHLIAIDGSLYEKMPGYATAIEETIGELLGEKAALVECCLSKDSSGVGAAVAAAIAAQS